MDALTLERWQFHEIVVLLFGQVVERGKHDDLVQCDNF